jgi:nicotinamidase-related amidase
MKVAVPTAELPQPGTNGIGWRGYLQVMSFTPVLVVDMLNAYRHPDADKLIPNVVPIIDPLKGLLARAHASDDVDVVYINDNYGDFTADHRDIVAAALDGRRPDLVEPIVPPRDCRMLTKVRHSAFYSTALGYLLGRLETKRVIITGQVTEQCILYTALDAYIRHFEVVIPPDGIAHIDADLGSAALQMMNQNMAARLLPAAQCV